MTMQGVYIPIVTPFSDGRLDLDSYARLLDHYVAVGIHGFVSLGTTGEAPTVEESEYPPIIRATLDVVGSRVPIYVGVSSNSTARAVHLVRTLSQYSFEGFLVTSPYFNLPSQEGIVRHYQAVAQATDKKIVLYNIPQRTGRNMENETTRRLSEIPNVVGIKDSSGNVVQSMDLLRDHNPAFSVMGGEDVLFYYGLVHGGSGAILAAAQIRTEQFLKTYKLVQENDHKAALREWNTIAGIVPLLFKEPNPAPIKYILAKKGLIRSDEVRPPLAPISASLKATFDGLIAEGVL